MAKKLAKKQTGGSGNPSSPRATSGPPKKQVTTSSSGDYKTITKNSTEPFGNKSGSTTKVRRTVKGVLSGAPTVRAAKAARANDTADKGNGNYSRYPNFWHKGMGDFKKSGGATKSKKK